MIVVDVNILANYTIKGARTEEAHRLWALNDYWLIPSFWRIEFQSVLWKCVRFQGMSKNEALAVMEQAIDLFSVNEQDISPGAALLEALSSGISVYDAQYVALARQLNIPCVTLDKALQKTCPDRVVLIDTFLSNRLGDGLIQEGRADYKVNKRRKQTKKARAAKD